MTFRNRGVRATAPDLYLPSNPQTLLAALASALGQGHPAQIVDLDDAARRRGRRHRRLLAGRPDPFVDRDVAHPEQLGDHPLADAAQAVEQAASAFIAGGLPRAGVAVKLRPHALQR